jgi:hypothetical protein
MVLTLAAGGGVVTAAEIMTPLESARALAHGMRTTRLRYQIRIKISKSVTWIT